ncbi:AsmA-like C-terminal region-containing protein [Belliella kenyensis]|uniref:AsmA-like C-terminal region-containing protein n=1 Tax=Belliella kenyensis TaxID=1472724 RepID=A0ABV8EI43_9BACT|nr:AsmA-like C-terminal region-containing protein [Belliella kenyensis]MCH7401405.1 AsmA family protein [Belliella kenyensis]MDN3602848.1 AsmA-like C-terminal region-containing protein [Belliella kenyensis]
MKKAVYIILAIFAFLLVALVATPFIFKDKILERVDREIAGSVNAQVHYDFRNISLSVFRRFPDISVTLRDFGITGNPPFQNDTLVHVNRMQVDFNLWSILFSDVPSLTGVHLDGGSLYVKVLEDGQANYDIAIPSESQEVSESNFQINIDLIELNNLDFIYNDRSSGFFMALGNVQLEGKGDFTADQYRLPVTMEALIADVTFDGTNYLKNKNFKGKTAIDVDMANMKFAFADGDFQLNDFLFDLYGHVALPSDDIDFDLNFEGRNNTFKSILSLVPGIYTESFSGLNTSGTMDFKGFFKGVMNETSFPSFDIGLKIVDGMFQYPDLPRPVSDVQLDMQIVNTSNNLDLTKVHIPTFSLNFGSNPISGNLLLENLVTYDIDGRLVGKLNLEEVTSIFPIEGMALKGMLDVNATAKGRYDSVANMLPAINAKMLLSNGFIKSNEYPAPIEKLNVNASIVNNSGQMTDFLVDLSKFEFELEDEDITGNLQIRDFELLQWDGAIQGTVDIGKLMAIFPMDNTIMEGKIRADLNSKGSYKDVELERFDRLDTKGSLGVEKFYYTSLDLPQGIRINEAQADFTPARINLSKFDSRVGESPLTATGFLSNYMNYLLKENETLKGQLSLESSKFNVNQWLTESDAAEESELSVIELPKNIDFTMSVNAGEVIYDNLNLKQVKGNMALKDGVLSFSDASMNALGGQLVMNGSYDPRDITAPKFDFNFNVIDLSIAEAFDKLNTVKVLAPVAQHLTGKFSTKMDFSGLLGQDMMPILSSLDGKGVLRVLEAAYQNSPLVQSVTNLTRLNDTNTLQFRNLNLPVKIDNGVLNLSPVDLRLWDYQANVQGSTGFDGSINYLLNMQVPAGRFGAQANNLLATIAGTEANASTLIPVAITLGGTYGNPRVGLAGGNSIETLLTNALRSRVNNERENLQAKATEQFKAAEDSVKNELRSRAEALQDSAKREAERKVADTKDRAVEEAKNVLKGVLGNRNRPAAKPDTTKSGN